MLLRDVANTQPKVASVAYRSSALMKRRVMPRGYPPHYQPSRVSRETKAIVADSIVFPHTETNSPGLAPPTQGKTERTTVCNV